MTEDQEKTWVWLAGNEARTIDNIIKVIEKLKQDQKELYEGGKKNTESRNNNA